ncbi:hypothetical protein BpHYR1_030652 [Brachionus plicatilis]|uniref:Uncharacterized protein n=1 Tax=Brachionus plicatilis TaxID=10195 RepID=A0A3M7QZG7_BRAPC|nr:hypothetical protein BpHYR1_030652 [Brachionus plicatilis]
MPININITLFNGKENLFTCPIPSSIILVVKYSRQHNLQNLCPHSSPDIKSISNKVNRAYIFAILAETNFATVVLGAARSALSAGIFFFKF